MTATVTIPLERWEALMEERAELLAFKLETLLARPQAPRRRRKATGPVPDEFFIRRIQKAVMNDISAAGLSMNGWCKSRSINKKVLWLLVHHFEHLESGREILGDATLTKLAARFLPQAEEARP